MTTIEASQRITVSTVMSSPPLMVSMRTCVSTAWSLMMAHGVRHLLVADCGRCVGLVDDRLVFAQWPLGPAALRRELVASIMRAPLVCVRPDTDLAVVAVLMLRESTDAVAVVDDEGVGIGIVTSSDVVAAVAGVRSEGLRGDLPDDHGP